MRVVYIAGPFRGPSAWAVEQNVRRAEDAALEVWRMGAAALCPHTNTRFFDGLETPGLWLSGTLELMRRCDAVLVLATCTDGVPSVGTSAEISEALRVGLPVFYDREHLGHWVVDQEGQING